MPSKKKQDKGQVIHLHPRQRLIMTYDGDETGAGPETAERQLRSLVQSIEGSHIGIFQRCIGMPGVAQKTSVPGLEPRPGILRWIEAGEDPMVYFVDECHRSGIQAWGSCRMNDAHHTYAGLDYSQPKFYKEHPELRLKSVPPHQLSATYDWNKPLIAEQHLALLREVAETWDVDGIDLDYTRMPPFFNPDETEKGRETMNQHLRNIRAMLDEVGENKGKRLGLSAQFYTEDTIWKELDDRNHDDIEGLFQIGLDVRTWAREGLIDILIAHCRAASLYEMDMSGWRKAIEGTNCSLAAGPGKPTRFKFGRGGLVDGFPASRTNRLQHRAIAHRLYEQGVDGIFFYDYLVRNHELQWEVFRELGDPERMRDANKTYVFQMALPLVLGPRAEGGEGEMEIDIPDDIPGGLAAGAPVGVRFLINVTRVTSVAEVTLEVNGQEVPVEREQGITLPLTVTDHPEDNEACHLQAIVDPKLIKRGRNRLAFTLRPTPGVHEFPKPEPAEVRKVDVEITHRDETFPYWLAVQLEHKR